MKKILQYIMINKIQSFVAFCFIFSISMMYFNDFIPVSKFIAIFVTIIFVLGLLLINFLKSSTNILYTIALIQMILTVATYWHDQNYDFKVLIIVSISLIILLVILLINILTTSLYLVNLTEPNSVFERILYNVRFLYPILAYLFLELIIILIFAVLYEGFNNYALINNLHEGVFYSGTTNRIRNMDPLYFSSVTFFTVGYGDIVPAGDTIKLIVQAQMFIGSKVLSMILPILITILFGFINIRKEAINK